jgi:hypothetical protein
MSKKNDDWKQAWMTVFQVLLVAAAIKGSIETLTGRDLKLPKIAPKNRI